jgi:hypothetical protein
MIDVINDQYKRNLNKMQENDQDMIYFAKDSIGKFSNGILNFGKELKDVGHDMSAVVDVIDAEVDITIFIE